MPGDFSQIIPLFIKLRLKTLLTSVDNKVYNNFYQSIII